MSSCFNDFQRVPQTLQAAYSRQLLTAFELRAGNGAACVRVKDVNEGIAPAIPKLGGTASQFVPMLLTEHWDFLFYNNVCEENLK